jgi:hypothetical protein
MALSDSEQRKLDEIERALAGAGAHRPQQPSADLGRRHRRLVAVGVLLIGMLILLIGLVATAVALVVGIVISVIGVGMCAVAVAIAGFHQSESAAP